MTKNIYSNRTFRYNLIKLAHDNPEVRGEVLPLILAYDKQSAMQKEAFIKSLIQKIGKSLPASAKRMFGKYAKKLRNASWEGVYKEIINQISKMGRSLGMPNLGSLIDKGIRKLSIRKLWDVVVAYIRGGYESLLNFFNITPPPNAVRVARNKEAVDPLMAISGGVAILVVIAATVFLLSNLPDDFFGWMMAGEILEGAGNIIAGIFEIISES